jgi:DNA processing protein
MLIRDGAPLVRGLADIIKHVGDPRHAAPASGPTATPSVASNPNPLPDDILSLLGQTPMAEDQLLRSLGAAPTAVAPY